MIIELEFQVRYGASGSSSQSNDERCMIAHITGTSISAALGDRDQAVRRDERAVEAAENRP